MVDISSQTNIDAASFDATNPRAASVAGGLHVDAGGQHSASYERWGTASSLDYVLLLKPRVMSLSIFTALVGMVLAPEPVHWVIGLAAILCISIGAGAAGALNMWYEAELDAKMCRTAKRPLPNGRIAPDEALAFGVVLAFGSVLSMAVLVNYLAAALLALTIFYYVVVYTMWLKPRTAQNIVVGGAAGAFPPVIGWVAATGEMSLAPWVLFLIIFMWTPPHFWALALVRARDYADAGLPMMPVVAGAKSTRRQILAYTLALLATTGVPYWMGMAGELYAGAAAVLGAWFLVSVVRLMRAGARGSEDAANRAAMGTFKFSLVYLFGLFVALFVEGVWF